MVRDLGKYSISGQRDDGGVVAVVAEGLACGGGTGVVRWYWGVVVEVW